MRNHLNINIKSLSVVELRLVISASQAESVLSTLFMIVFVTLVQF